MKKNLFFFAACLLTSTSFANDLASLSNKAMPLPIVSSQKVENVTIHYGGFGSAGFTDPQNANQFYAMTDRGPNIDGKDKNTKVFPDPAYTPTIGHFAIHSDGTIGLLNVIKMKQPNGQLLTGLPNPSDMGATGETAVDLQGKVLKPDPYGIDSEGLVVLKDGSFWVSDEYGPHLVHFNKDGLELERMSPVGINTGGRKLPAVLAKRMPNRGMEGLAITPDEQTLVGIMQSTLFNPSKKEASNKSLVRLLTFNLKTGQTHQYLYRQDKKKMSNSEITAVDGHRFLVDERDGKYPGDKKLAVKRVYLIDLDGATDVSASIDVPNGKLVNGKTLEQNSWEELEKAGIKPVSKKLVMDLVKDHQYPHDKFEGMWIIDKKYLAVVNDDDFGIESQDGVPKQKVLPLTGKVDASTLYLYALPQWIYQ